MKELLAVLLIACIYFGFMLNQFGGLSSFVNNISLNEAIGHGIIGGGAMAVVGLPILALKIFWDLFFGKSAREERAATRHIAAPVIENIPSPVVSNLNVQPENKEKYDAIDLLEAKKLENRFFSAITSSEAQIEAEKQVQITPLKSQRSQLPWRDILGTAILLLCVGTFAWAVNSLLQFFS